MNGVAAFSILALTVSLSLARPRVKGLLRQEGKEYVVQDGDVMLFKFNV